MTETSTKIDEIDPYSSLQDQEPPKAPRNHWLDVWDQFKRHKGAVFGGGFLIFITLAVLLGPYIWNVEPQKLDIRNKDVRPIWTIIWDSSAKTLWHRPFGTDNLGRDILANMIAGGRASMAVGWTAMLLSLIIGTAIGIAAGYFKRLDGLLMRLTDLFLCLPILPLLLVAVTLFRQPLRANFGPEGGMFILIVVVVGVTSWMQTARIVRGEILALKEREFILAARSIGTTPGAIIRRHLLPNVISPIMVSATLGLAVAIITESASVIFRRWVPIRFSHMGENASRCSAANGAISRTRLIAGYRNLINRAGGQLPGRWAAGRIRSTHPRSLIAASSSRWT